MILGITGGKGGTGKSTVATALAAQLSAKRRTLLVDADVGCPNDHILLDIKRKLLCPVYQTIPVWNNAKCTRCGICSKTCRYNAIIQVKDKYPIFIEQQCNGCRACILACPENAIKKGEKKIGNIYKGEKGKIKFLSGEILPGHESEEPVVKKLVRQIRNQNTVIDTAAGTHCDVIAALEPCDLAIAVTEPTPFGAHDLALILELLEKIKKPSKIVLNKSTIGNKELIKKVAEKYSTEIIAEIPYTKEIMRKYRNSEPLDHPAIREIADSI